METSTLTPINILIFVALLLAIGAYFMWRRERRKKWNHWASARGFSYVAKTSGQSQFGFVQRISDGHSHEQHDFMSGSKNGHRVDICNYLYKTTHTDDEGDDVDKNHWHGLAILQTPGWFPALRIEPENALKRIGHVVTGSDIDFESLEFSRRYEVKSDDKRFAYDFCNARMIELLLAHPKTRIEADGSAFAIVKKGKWRLEELDDVCELLVDVRALLPAYLFETVEGTQ